MAAIAKATEAEAGADKSFRDGYFLAQLHVAQHTSPNFNLHQICSWNREEIMVGADGVPKVLLEQSVPTGGGDAASSSDLTGSDKREPDVTENVLGSPPVESGSYQQGP